jgi:hypothetical protein
MADHSLSAETARVDDPGAPSVSARDVTPENASEGDAAAEGGETPPEDAAPVIIIRTRPGWLVAMPYWALSGAVHIVFCVVIGSLVHFQRLEDKPPPVIHVSMQRPPVDYEPEPPRDLERKIRIPIPLNDVSFIPRLLEKSDTLDPAEAIGVDDLAVSDTNLKSFYLNDNLGLSGGAAGAYGARIHKGSLLREGGSEATESAVRAALDWLVRHQHPDGSWRALEFALRCKTICRNLDAEAGTGQGSKDYDLGVTALAVLAFTGAGENHKRSADLRYKECLRKALDWILRQQQRSSDQTINGRFGKSVHHNSMYEHAIATMAITELLILSGDSLHLKRPVKRAMRYCLRAQNKGAGWRYDYQGDDSDVSMTGWMVLALKTGEAAPIALPDVLYDTAFADTRKYISAMTDGTGWTHYRERSKDRSGLPCMTAVGVLSRIFAGDKPASYRNRRGVKCLMKNLPRWAGSNTSAVNFYYWYYGTYALFQSGGDDWLTWNAAMQDALLNSQRRGGIDEDGSWDPVGRWSRPGGRVYSTALGAMTLEVYYRYKRSESRPELRDLRTFHEPEER